MKALEKEGVIKTTTKRRLLTLDQFDVSRDLVEVRLKTTNDMENPNYYLKLNSWTEAGLDIKMEF